MKRDLFHLSFSYWRFVFIYQILRSGNKNVLLDKNFRSPVYLLASRTNLKSKYHVYNVVLPIEAPVIIVLF